MSASSRIALVCPHPWPPRDDIAHHVAAEAAALAARGHAVTVLAPARRRDAVTAGRARLAAAAGREDISLSPLPGDVLELAVGRALPAGRGRRVGDPFDLARGLRAAISHRLFDVVHLHEPLAPSPALATLRHAHGVVAVSFHRAEPLAGAALLLPLIQRALARADLRLTTSRTTRDAIARIVPGDYDVVRPGVDALAPETSATGPPRLVLIARGRDRAGVRFLTAVLRGLDPSRFGEVVLIGPADAPWRTRAAVPAALREAVTVTPDDGPASRGRALAGGGVVLVAEPAEAAGPAMGEALAAGCAVVAPRGPAAEEAARDGGDALLLPAYDRAAWTREAGALAADGGLRASLADAARPARRWDAAAAELESAYRHAAGRREERAMRARGVRNPHPDS